MSAQSYFWQKKYTKICAHIFPWKLQDESLRAMSEYLRPLPPAPHGIDGTGICGSGEGLSSLLRGFHAKPNSWLRMVAPPLDLHRAQLHRSALGKSHSTRSLSLSVPEGKQQPHTHSIAARLT